jgi:protein sidekick
MEKNYPSKVNGHLILQSWTPLPKEDFNGDPQTGGYIIEYRELSDFPSPLHSYPRVQLKGIYVREHNLSDLTIGKNYEIIVIPFNSQGNGPPSRPVSVYVGEAVPTGSPRSVKAEAVSATEVRVSWRPPKADQQNGDLSGYKIFYHAAPLNAKNLEEIEVISASDTSHSLIFLEMYTNYTISILVSLAIFM